MVTGHAFCFEGCGIDPHLRSLIRRSVACSPLQDSSEFGIRKIETKRNIDLEVAIYPTNFPVSSKAFARGINVIHKVLYRLSLMYSRCCLDLEKWGNALQADKHT